jgi:hypothetical protein
MSAPTLFDLAASDWQHLRMPVVSPERHSSEERRSYLSSASRVGQWRAYRPELIVLCTQMRPGWEQRHSRIGDELAVLARRPGGLVLIETRLRELRRDAGRYVFLKETLEKGDKSASEAHAAMEQARATWRAQEIEELDSTAASNVHVAPICSKCLQEQLRPICVRCDFESAPPGSDEALALYFA